ncbi:unnamed protein product [Mycena citricolor]|uniref:HMG box domain-containing protein n=1 Tax=Mycena citricolor TaxID=2018698 RepID=A0AAD2H4W9_9AGAR|nr:unnamed protein product [Mycena citricolor]
MPVSRTSIYYSKCKSRGPHNIDSADGVDTRYKDTSLSPTVSSPESTSHTLSSASPPPSPPQHYIPRPRNAFFCFRSAFNSRQKDASLGLLFHEQTEISRGAGSVWQAMGPEERRPYVEEAKALKREHARLYPNCRYSPGAASGIPRKVKKQVKGPNGFGSDDDSLPGSILPSDEENPGFSMPPIPSPQQWRSFSAQQRQWDSRFQPASPLQPHSFLSPSLWSCDLLPMQLGMPYDAEFTGLTFSSAPNAFGLFHSSIIGDGDGSQQRGLESSMYYQNDSLQGTPQWH